MKPSCMVSKKARKSSRYRSLHRHVHVPNRHSNWKHFSMPTYGGGFSGTILRGLAMLRMLLRPSGKHAKGRMEATP